MAGINYYNNIYCLKKTLKDSTHSSTTEDLIKRVSPCFDEINFIRFADITDYDRIGIPVVNSIRPSKNGMTVSHGKGITLDAAMASALMESVERFYAGNTEIMIIRDTYNSLQKKYNIISLENIQMTKHSIFSEENLEFWTKGWDIVNKEEIIIPYNFVVMDNKFMKKELDSFFKSSNGLSASLNFVEAVSQALFEVIERDAVTNSLVASQSRNLPTHMKRVIPESITSYKVKELIDKIESANVYWSIFDCTVDTNVPTYECQLIDIEEPNLFRCRGMGTNLNAEIAMLRAITEAVQARAVSLSGIRELFFQSEMYPLKLLSNKDLIKILEEKSNPPWEWVDANIHEDISTDSFEEDINICIKNLENIGLNQVIVVDLTPSGKDFSVVRVIVPGLEAVEEIIYYTPGKRAKEYMKGKMI